MRARRQSSAASTPESGSSRTGPDEGEAGKALCGRRGRHLLDGRAGGGHGGGDGVLDFARLPSSPAPSRGAAACPSPPRDRASVPGRGAPFRRSVPRDSRDGRCGRRPWSPSARDPAPPPPRGPRRPSPGGPAPRRSRVRGARRRPQRSGGCRARPAIIRTVAPRPRARKGAAVRSAAVTTGWTCRCTRCTTPFRSRATRAERARRSRRRPRRASGARRRAAQGPARPSASTCWRLACFTVPAVVLWWHVWSGHPSSALTCGCGDPAQEVWFMAWPAWAITHLHSIFFSRRGERPPRRQPALEHVGAAGRCGARSRDVALRSRHRQPTWRSPWPRRSAHGPASPPLRPLVDWKAGAIPAALVFGYSAALVTSLTLGHVSVTVLVIPPFLFTTLYEIVIRQEHSVAARRAAAGRAAGGAVLHLTRDPGDVPPSGSRRVACGRRWSAGARCGRAPDMPFPPSASPPP